jgi:hypothetical protein
MIQQITVKPQASLESKYTMDEIVIADNSINQTLTLLSYQTNFP